MSGASKNSGSSGIHTSVHNNNYYQQPGGSQSRPEYRHQGQETSPSPASRSYSYTGMVNRVPPTGTPGPQFQSRYTHHGQAGQNNATGRPLQASGISTTMPATGQHY